MSLGPHNKANQQEKIAKFNSNKVGYAGVWYNTWTWQTVEHVSALAPPKFLREPSTIRKCILRAGACFFCMQPGQGSLVFPAEYLYFLTNCQAVLFKFKRPSDFYLGISLGVRSVYWVVERISSACSPCGWVYEVGIFSSSSWISVFFIAAKQYCLSLL